LSVTPAIEGHLMPRMAIQLSGLYEDAEARDYTVLQEDVQRSERDGFTIHVRVMRQNDPETRSGTVSLSNETWTDAGPSDEARSNAIGRALVWWLPEHPVRTAFHVRVALVYTGNVPTVELRERDTR
jgi:hypothetical protein